LLPAGQDKTSPSTAPTINPSCEIENHNEGRTLCTSPSGATGPRVEVRNAVELFVDGIRAWNGYRHGGYNPPVGALVEAIEYYNRALESAPQGHHFRKAVLLALIFALLEQDNDRQSLEKIEEYFVEIEGWSGLETPCAHAVASKLGAAYENLHRDKQVPSRLDFESSLANYIKARGYSRTVDDQVVSESEIISLFRQGDVEMAMKTLDSIKTTCPSDQPDVPHLGFKAKFLHCQDKYRCSGLWKDLENVITEGEAALRIEMQPGQRATVLTDVAHCIYVLSVKHSSEASPEEIQAKVKGAIGYARQAVELANGDKHLLNRANTTLANLLSSRSARPTVPELDEAIALYRKAKEKDQGDLDVMASLADAICFRCETGGERVYTGTTLQSAIALYKGVLAVSRDTDWNSVIANNIAAIHVESGRRTRAKADYAEASRNYARAADMSTDSNDKAYYKTQAETINEIIALRGRRRERKQSESGRSGQSGGSCGSSCGSRRSRRSHRSGSR
jgi:tetratricopeptide (TPR) repeat protein